MSEETEYKNFYKKIGARVLELRIEKKLTQEQLALECDMEATNLSQIERGRRNLTSKTLYDLCKALEISIVDFFKEFEK